MSLSALPATADEDQQPTEQRSPEEQSETKEDAKSGASGGSGKTSGKSAARSDFEKLTGEAKTFSGLIKLHQKDAKLYAELKSSNLDKDYIVLISIAKGIGDYPLLGGMTYFWGMGDSDWIWQFRKVGDRIHVVRRNVRFTAKSGSPEEKAVKLAYTDSVLFSLPIVAKAPGGGHLIDLSSVFMSDLPQISSVLTGFSFSSTKSTWADIQAFDDNVELQVAATYASSGRRAIDSVPDTRGATINVHYSISALPKTGYKPRAADPRIGYFTTVVKDYSKDGDEDRFVRYINRWHLEKSDPSAERSPPKEPIVFWLEKTIPFKYRKPIRDGILEWNKAFEDAGFYDAIEVRQQPDDAPWDPGDINFNTFRWITASAALAMGPSRVDPRTGQILDADIIFDADYLRYWKQEYETFTPQSIARLTGRHMLAQGQPESMLHQVQHSRHAACEYGRGTAHELALSSAVFAARTQNPEDLEKLVMQALKDTAMHEIGHTLGLRHNFKASTLFTLEELNNPKKTSKTGISASVMDYTPVNIVPAGMEQGDYYSTTIGPYDYWAIDYGYRPDSSDDDLATIASRSGEKELAYATDHDARSIDPDPHSARYDLGNDNVAFARQRAKLVAEALPDVVERMTDEGEGFEQARRAFNVLLATHFRTMHTASRYIGGLYVSRSLKGDKDADPPFRVVDADKQREVLKLLDEALFSDKPYQFDPGTLNHLAATNWSHWGTRLLLRTDYPIHDFILMWQDEVLYQLLSSQTLSRLYDSELKVASDEDAFTVAELLDRMTESIFHEVSHLEEGEYTNRNPAISSIRRNLQRAFLKRISQLALGETLAPDDCQSVAYVKLSELREQIDELLASELQLDRYSKAHLQETSARIGKVLDARITTRP